MGFPFFTFDEMMLGALPGSRYRHAQVFESATTKKEGFKNLPFLSFQIQFMGEQMPGDEIVNRAENQGNAQSYT